MNTKKREFIDPNELMRYINKNHSYSGLPMAAHICTMELLTYAPRVDAVEVVRCKDCKWYDRNEDFMPQSGSCEFHEMVKMDWDFCSRAKMDGDGNG